MTAELRIVSFLVDPFLGTSFPVGALVCTGGRATFVESPHLPGVECLGGRVNAALLAGTLRSLRTITNTSTALPSSSLRVSSSLSVPAGVDPASWAGMLLAGQREIAPHTEKHTPVQDPRRETQAKNFYRQHQVAEYVRGRFSPGETVEGVLAGHERLPSITQHVFGNRRLLLVEPIILGRKHFDADLKQVVTHFAAYRHFLDQRDQGWDVRLCALVLSGGSRDRREATIHELSGAAHDVVNVEDARSRVSFVEAVRAVGSSATPSMLPS